jgi:hypothetical protein
MSQRTAISVRLRRARYACHFRHSTSLLRGPSSRLRGGTIQRVGEVRANLDGAGLLGRRAKGNRQKSTEDMDMMVLVADHTTTSRPWRTLTSLSAPGRLKS